MSSIGARFAKATLETAINTPLAAAGGAIIGFVYGKLADLPLGQSVKVWAIWNAAEVALIAFARTFIEGHKTKAFVVTTIPLLTTTVGIQELNKKGLLGKKMTIALIVVQAIVILDFLASLNTNS